jgi:hypothetical protein
MRSISTLLTVAAALAIALPAAAQGASSPSASAAAAEPSASASTPAAASAKITAGLSVKDNTGATIGQVSEVKASGGKQMATIKMGAESFAVDTSSLAVADGAATINATQAELKDMIKKAGGGSAAGAAASTGADAEKTPQSGG